MPTKTQKKENAMPAPRTTNTDGLRRERHAARLEELAPAVEAAAKDDPALLRLLRCFDLLRLRGVDATQAARTAGLLVSAEIAATKEGAV